VVQRDIRQGPTAVPTEGRRVKLTPLSQSDYDFLYSLFTDPEIMAWRFSGTVPSPEAFVQSLWAGVLASFVPWDKVGGRKLGLCWVYNADFRSGHAYVAVVLDRRSLTGSSAYEATALFMNYVFRVWPFRKLYGEVSELSFSQFAHGATRDFEVEGRLTSHYFYDGRYWDQIITATERDAWFARHGRPLGRMLAGGRV
jgi:RimJ/RimL family protein N-acetyltransferase